MTIREYTLNLLKDAGCPENAYHRVTVEQAIEDIRKYEARHGKCDFPAEDVGKELVLIANNESLEPYTPPPALEGFAENGDASKWGLTDLYEEDEKILRDAIASGERFDTGWVGCKKEIRSMRISRDEKICVQCHAEMDSALEQLDLFTDFLTNEECKKLTDEAVDQIREMLMESCCYAEEAEYSDYLLSDATYEQVMEVVAGLEQNCEDFLNDSFHECIEDTLWILYPDMPEKEKIEMISDRIEGVNA